VLSALLKSIMYKIAQKNYIQKPVDYIHVDY
jgi:hypothetical protein